MTAMTFVILSAFMIAIQLQSADYKFCIDVIVNCESMYVSSTSIFSNKLNSENSFTCLLPRRWIGENSDKRIKKGSEGQESERW